MINFMISPEIPLLRTDLCHSASQSTDEAGCGTAQSIPSRGGRVSGAARGITREVRPRRRYRGSSRANPVNLPRASLRSLDMKRALIDISIMKIFGRGMGLFSLRPSRA